MCLEDSDIFTPIHNDEVVNGMSLYRDFLVDPLQHILIGGRCYNAHQGGNPFTLTLKEVEEPLGAIWGFVS